MAKTTYSKMKKDELEALLLARGLPIGGTKLQMASQLFKGDEKREKEKKEEAGRATEAEREDEQSRFLDCDAVFKQLGIQLSNVMVSTTAPVGQPDIVGPLFDSADPTHWRPILVEFTMRLSPVHLSVLAIGGNDMKSKLTNALYQLWCVADGIPESAQYTRFATIEGDSVTVRIAGWWSKASPDRFLQREDEQDQKKPGVEIPTAALPLFYCRPVRGFAAEPWPASEIRRWKAVQTSYTYEMPKSILDFLAAYPHREKDALGILHGLVEEFFAEPWHEANLRVSSRNPARRPLKEAGLPIVNILRVGEQGKYLNIHFTFRISRERAAIFVGYRTTRKEEDWQDMKAFLASWEHQITHLEEEVQGEKSMIAIGKREEDPSARYPHFPPHPPRPGKLKREHWQAVVITLRGPLTTTETALLVNDHDALIAYSNECICEFYNERLAPVPDDVVHAVITMQRDELLIDLFEWHLVAVMERAKISACTAPEPWYILMSPLSRFIETVEGVEDNTAQVCELSKDQFPVVYEVWHTECWDPDTNAPKEPEPRQGVPLADAGTPNDRPHSHDDAGDTSDTGTGLSKCTCQCVRVRYYNVRKVDSLRTDYITRRGPDGEEKVVLALLPAPVPEPDRKPDPDPDPEPVPVPVPEEKRGIKRKDRETPDRPQEQLKRKATEVLFKPTGLKRKYPEAPDRPHPQPPKLDDDGDKDTVEDEPTLGDIWRAVRADWLTWLSYVVLAIAGFVCWLYLGDL
jgi:hypothetical protein